MVTHPEDATRRTREVEEEEVPPLAERQLQLLSGSASTVMIQLILPKTVPNLQETKESLEDLNEGAVEEEEQEHLEEEEEEVVDTKEVSTIKP